MSQNNGGPVFPQQAAGIGNGIKGGMSLRDWFAGMALQGLMSRPFSEYPAIPGDVSYTEHFAYTAYAYADVMLKARSQ